MNNRLIILLAMVCVMISCKQKQQQAPEKDVIGKSEVKVESGQLSPEVLWAFGRIGNVDISPDGKKVLYTVTCYSIEENKSNAEIYTMNTDGSDVRRLTATSSSEWNVVWNPKGDKIGFLYADETGINIYEMNPDGSDKTQISNFTEGDLEAFSYAPDGKKLLYVRALPKVDKFARLKNGLDKTTGRINDDLAYRHWDDWVDNVPQPFVADFDGKKLSNDINLLDGTEFESPMRPWGGMEQLAWSPDSKTIAYTCRKKTGKEYAFSTNSDIYLYDLINKTTANLTEGMMGYDQNPVFSPDGKLLAWESMERDGYEADKQRLMVCDLATRTIKDYSQNFDQNCVGLKFAPDSRSIYFISDWHAKDNIYNLSLADGAIKEITNTVQDYTAVNYVSDKLLVATQMSISHPAEIWTINPENGQQAKISSVNDELMSQVKWGRVEERWFKATDGSPLHSWIIYPPDFDSTKSYPTLLYCEGGPQSTVSQFWSYRWNFQIMASHGYIIVAPNRRGLPGFGVKWNEAISGDYGGQCMKDYLTAIDEMCKEKYVDKDRLGAVGASFGGFSVYWLAGHHNKRFKCFIAHNGMFNFEQQYLETEEMWFEEWDLGGAYWVDNSKTRHSYANSPHKFVDKWDTPILVIHSENDYRIVASQGMAAYNAAVIRGIPARYLYFPDESHWVLKPQNGVLWQRNFFDWLDTWLKK